MENNDTPYHEAVFGGGLYDGKKIFEGSYEHFHTCSIAIHAAVFFSMIDQVMVGQLGDQSVAAVEIASRPGFIYDFLVSAISTIAAIMTSQYIGKNNREAEEMISSASMWNMDGMAVMGICEDAYQKLLCHRTRDFLDRCWI